MRQTHEHSELCFNEGLVHSAHTEKTRFQTLTASQRYISFLKKNNRMYNIQSALKYWTGFSTTVAGAFCKHWCKKYFDIKIHCSPSHGRLSPAVSGRLSLCWFLLRFGWCPPLLSPLSHASLQTSSSCCRLNSRTWKRRKCKFKQKT